MLEGWICVIDAYQKLLFSAIEKCPTYKVELSLVLESQSLDLLRLRVYEWKDMSNGPFLSFHNCELNFASVDILIKWTHLACPINFCPEY